MTAYVDVPLFGDPLDGPGQARATDPDTSHAAARLVTARAGTARVRLLRAHGRNPDGLTDEEAATSAGLALTSEYATRCAELRTLGVLADTDERRAGSSGVDRVVRQLTPYGAAVLRERGDL